MMTPAWRLFESRGRWGHPSASRDDGDQRRDAFGRSSLVLRNNRQRLAALLGPPTQYWTGEFRFHVWPLRHGGTDFYLLTAKGKGTCVAVACPWEALRSRQVTRDARGLLEALHDGLAAQEAAPEPGRDGEPGGRAARPRPMIARRRAGFRPDAVS